MDIIGTIVALLIGLPFIILPKCLDVFLVAYALGVNGIEGRTAKFMSVSFGLSAFFMGILALLLEKIVDYDSVFKIGLLIPVMFLVIYIDLKGHKRSLDCFDLKKIIIFSLISILTGLDVFCEGIVSHFLFNGVSHSIFPFIVDAITAMVVGYCGINLGRKWSNAGLGCSIVAFSLLYYWGYVMTGAAVNLRPD